MFHLASLSQPKRQTIYLGIALSLMFVFMAFIVYWRLLVNAHLLHLEEPLIFEVFPRDNPKSIAKRLQEKNHLSHPKAFVWEAKLRRMARKLHIGEYLLTKQTTIKNLVNMIGEGKVQQYPFTIVEGCTLKDILEALAKHEKIDATATTNNVNLHELLNLEQNSLEGGFYPDTYFFTKNTTDLAILERAMHAMQQKLESIWVTRDEGLAIKTKEQAIILASIIEKETSLAEEYKVISGVFHNRLKKGMRLQADPTVVYALGDKYKGKLSKADLKVQSPYNTYVHAGLPHGAIAMPGELALRAAVNPDKHDKLYFVVNGEGGHIFSATLAEHQKAVDLYIQRSKQKNAS